MGQTYENVSKVGCLVPANVSQLPVKTSVDECLTGHDPRVHHRSVIPQDRNILLV